MRSVGIAVAGLMILSSALRAQSPSPGPAPSANPSAGSSFEAVLTKTLDVRKSRVGDIVLARTTEEVQLSKDIHIPKNAKLIGQVTEVQIKGRGAAESRIGLRFDKAQMKDGREVPLKLSIESVAAAEEPSLAVPGRSGAVSFADSSVKNVQIDTSNDVDRVVSVLHSKSSNLRVESGALLVLQIIK